MKSFLTTIHLFVSLNPYSIPQDSLPGDHKIYTFVNHVWPPRARPHLHSARSRPSHASFIVQSSCPHLRGNFSPLGTNVIIPDQNYKYSNWHHFHYSQVNWWSSFTCQRRLMAQLTKYCHIGSQHGRVSMQVRIGRLGSEGGVGGAGPSQRKLWSSLGPCG